MIHAGGEPKRRELAAAIVIDQFCVAEQIDQGIGEPLGLQHRAVLDPPTGAHQRIAGTREHGGVSVDRPGSRFELAREAFVQAVETFRLGLAQVQIGEQPPNRDGGCTKPGPLDSAHPADEQGEPAARNPVGEQEVEVLLLQDAHQPSAGGHVSVTRLKYSPRGGSSVTHTTIIWTAAACTLAAALPKIRLRLQLSHAKHRSVTGHARMARRLARLIPFYEYGEDRVFKVDDAPQGIAGLRRAGFMRLAAALTDAFPQKRRSDRGGDRGHFRSAVHQPLPRSVPIQPLRSPALQGRRFRVVLLRRHVDRSGRQPSSTTSPAPTASTCSATISTRSASPAAASACAIWARCSAPTIR